MPPPPATPDQTAARPAPSEPAGYPPAAVVPPARPPRKPPVLASVLSALPGVGQVYVGYYKLGFIHNMVFAGTIMVINLTGEPLIPLSSPCFFFFWVYHIIDAGRRAVFYNLALEGVEGIELPRDMNVSLPSFGGSIGGEVSLIVVVFILLLNTRFGVSLAWVEQWWPVAPMALGVYLVAKAIQERGREVPTAEDDG